LCRPDRKDDKSFDFEQNNKPDYLGYHLNEDFEYWFTNQKRRISKHGIKSFSLSTDGIFTFSKFDIGIYDEPSKIISSRKNNNYIKITMSESCYLYYICMKYRSWFSQLLKKKLQMKFSAILCLLIIFACGCNRSDVQTDLLSEQKLLKDSANNINERVAGYMYKGHDDSAKAEKLQLAAVHVRLIDIQSSIDSLANVR
jgi:hypothetical protein